jgi:serine/threonine protein kinase
MSTSTGRHAIIFKEGPSYILSKPLRHGSQGQVYTVISLKDGKSYIRKRLQEFVDFSERAFYNRVPVSMAPELIFRTKYPNREGDALIYHFCTGGDLQKFNGEVRLKFKELPVVMYWVVIKKVSEILAFIHHGWRCRGGVVTIEENWNPIIHNDLHSGNIFLDWPDENATLPSVLLGDWGFAGLVEGPAEQDRKVRVNPEILNRDISLFINSLLLLNVNGPPELNRENGPIWYVRKLRDESMKLAMRGHDILLAQYMAERLVPIAEAAIKRLQDEDPVDLRWARPVDSGTFVTFNGSEEERERSLHVWSRKENHRRFIDEPWDWIKVERLPLSINYRMPDLAGLLIED